MLPEQLLQPRYKVIANYPQPPFSDESDEHKFIEGDILVKCNVNGALTFKRTGRLGYMSVGVPCCSHPEKYPKIFRLMDWWEGRRIEDMPGYLKVVGTDFIKFTKGQIIRVEKHKSNSFNQIVPSLFISKDKQGPPPHPDCFCYKDFLPATEAEYNAYINTK